ncbi:MAG: glucosidase [Candidatus Eremiobacteraeota bacterium]|nr:glucosidase [Candidatus Eremiobacteraeota bacterium]
MAMKQGEETAEGKRLEEEQKKKAPWKFWGPYLSDRQWGTVREDYSQSGNAWDYFTHDQARSRAYRWGEDGLGGISDEKQRLCFALALWNGNDPIIKERLFGLSNSEGNHGEDVKEYYYYLDSTPTHSYMKYLYKYPQEEFPYGKIVKTNAKLSRRDFEYELIHTGVFDHDRYFDVFAEFAKEAPDEILIKITACNRGDSEAPLHILPTLWFRNTWSWAREGEEKPPKPVLEAINGPKGSTALKASHHELGNYYFICEGEVPLLFTENETNNERIFGTRNQSPYVKDGINNYLVNGRKDAVNPHERGTKASPHYVLSVGPGKEAVVRLRITTEAPASSKSPSAPFAARFDKIMKERQEEADAFYHSITPPKVSGDERLVMRQALAGMLWTKQYFYYDVDRWLVERGIDPYVPGSQGSARNREWYHMVNHDIVSMPDKWEYPWYAAWDLAFHTVALGIVDLDFAKEQLRLLLHQTYLHPNGQIPAYEWNFSDVNPPVHPWATFYIYQMEKELSGKGDLEFLKAMFSKLLMNFTWWVNRKDRAGNNIFEGGFLGLDNIGVFDRSSPLPTGGHLEQADGTAWMALYTQNMMQISLELATHDPTYEPLALKFVDHFLWIANSIYRMGGEGMWDDKDGFFYDVLRLPDGRSKRLKVRSLVGLLPLCASTVLTNEVLEKFPGLVEMALKRLDRLPVLKEHFKSQMAWQAKYKRGRLLSLVDEPKIRRILSIMLDENEFLGDYGIRGISRRHLKDPYVLNIQGQEYRVDYEPAESSTGMFGGNSNWRGPVWLPMNVLILRSLLQLYQFYGDELQVECPTGSGNMMSLFEVSREIARRLESIFTRNREGKRPVFGGDRKFQEDPHFRDHLLFYEYFHGDNGAGLGASHQTGWTGLVARLIHLYSYLDSRELLEGKAAFVYKEPVGAKR